VQLPQTWVNSKEWIGTTSRTVTFPSSGSGGSWTCAGTNYGPYTASSQSSLQQAVNDAEACRTANGTGTQITIPAGMLFSNGPGITLPQTTGDTSTNFIVLQSSTPLTVGRTVCSHGIQDNVAASTQPGIRNVGCDGSHMSYQLGTTVTPINYALDTLTSMGNAAFTLANGTATNTSAYNDVASMYTIECTTNNCNALQTGTWDSNNIGPHHFAVLNAEIRPVPGKIELAPVSIGGSETLVSQIPTHIHLAYDYLHGDYTDAPVSGVVAVSAPTGSNVLPNDAFFNCLGCSLSYSYVDKSSRPGFEGHVLAFDLAQGIKLVHNWFEGQGIGHMCGGWSNAIPIGGFISCLDMEDRANRYTYPRSWLLAADAGIWMNSSMTTTSSGSGTGAILLNTGMQGGALISVSIQAAGTGHAVNDLLTISQPYGGTNGTALVTAVSGGAVTGVALTSGTGYAVANGLATTGGHGTGATVDITSVGPGGRITGVTLAAGGTGYQGSDNLTVVQTGGSGGVVAVTSVTSGVIQGFDVATGTGYTRDSYVRKNAHEYKFSNRVVLDGNIFENVDNSGAQFGITASFKTAQTSAGKYGDNYWTTQSDTTITNNIFRNACNGEALGQGDGLTDNNGGGTSMPAWKYFYANNLSYNISEQNPNCSSAGAHFGFRVNGRAPSTWAVTPVRVSNVTTLTLTGVPGAQQSTFLPGDSVVVYGCTDTSFNTATGQQTTLGPPALPGTLPTGMKVLYSNPGPDATDSSGTCTLYNAQGWTRYLTYRHNSEFVDASGDVPNYSEHTGGLPYSHARDLSFKDSIVVGGGAYSLYGEGARTLTSAFDAASLTFHHMVYAGRDSGVTCPGHNNAGAGGIDACYAAYDDAHQPISPPSSVIFGALNGNCTGNDPTAEACVGILGAMSTSTSPLVLNDWHLFRLCHVGDSACNGKASPFAAGGAHQSSDGKDLGADFSQIDAAQTASQYCTPDCGIGSYSDQ